MEPLASTEAPSAADIETARRNEVREAVVRRNESLGGRITRSDIKRSTWSSAVELFLLDGREPSLGVPPDKAVYVVATGGELKPSSYVSVDDPLGVYRWQIDVLTVDEDRTLWTFAWPRAGDWPAVFDGLMDT